MLTRSATDLLERDAEIDGLAQLVDAACAGSGAATLIEGEPGIGKTALLDDACRRGAAAGMTVLSARAGELEREFAWGVVRQLFEQHLARCTERERATLLAEAAALARPAIELEPESSSGDQPSFSTLHGLYWLTVNLAQQAPLLLAIDDLHWADRPSLRYVVHIAPRLAGLPILVLVTARPPGSEPRTDRQLLTRIVHDSGAPPLRPAPLSGRGCAALVRERLGGEVDDEFCLACHEMSGGNPFLLVALLDELQAEGIAPTPAGAAHVRRLTPDAVSRSVLMRLAMLPSGALALARAVAVLGPRAELRRARQLAELTDDAAAAVGAALVRARILHGDTVVEFVHPLVRAAIYNDLESAERGRWHQRAADLLAVEGAAPAELIPHLIASAPNADPLTVSRLRGTAAAARARGAPETAADCLKRALAEPPDADTRIEVLLELGEVEAMDDPGATVAELGEAFAAGARGPRQAKIALALGEALALCGRLSDAVAVYQAGIRELEGERAALRARLEAGLLTAARWDTNAQGLRHTALTELRARAREQERLHPLLHLTLAIEATIEGRDRDGAVGHARRVLEAADELAGHASAVPEAALVLTFADCAEEAWEILNKRLALAQRRGWPLSIATAATSASRTALCRGAISHALASARTAVTPGADIRVAPITVAFLIEALIERGEVAPAWSELSERELTGELPLVWAATPLLLARGKLHAAAGNHESAITDARVAGRRSQNWGVANPAMAPWRSSAAVSLALIGERAEAARLAAEEVELARCWGAPRPIGVALRAAAIAHGGRDGVDMLRESVAVLEDSPDPVELARALIELGSLLRRLGARMDSREPLRRGLDLAHRCGAMALATRAREELVVVGARPRRNALRGRDALTASELRVAELASQARTNNQIAQLLFVTPRTVETHLTSVYAKLGISSRAGLREALEKL